MCLYHVATHAAPGTDELLLQYRKCMPPSVLRLQTETDWARSVRCASLDSLHSLSSSGLTLTQVFDKFVSIAKLTPIQAKKLYLRTPSTIAISFFFSH